MQKQVNQKAPVTFCEAALDTAPKAVALDVVANRLHSVSADLATLNERLISVCSSIFGPFAVDPTMPQDSMAASKLSRINDSVSDLEYKIRTLGELVSLLETL